MIKNGACCPDCRSGFTRTREAAKPNITRFPLENVAPFFHAPHPEDKPWVDELIALSGYRGCEYNFTTLFVWNNTYRQEIARMGDFLLIRFQSGGCYRYAFPAGRGDLAPVIDALTHCAEEDGAPLCLVGLTQERIAQLEAAFPGAFTFIPNRNSFDYLYDIDRLADLTGKRLHAKRNHINRFMENNPTWRYERMTPAALSECLAMDLEWYRRRMERIAEQGGENPEKETEALRRALECFTPLKLEGGLLRVEGQVVAFTLGDRISGDTFDIHFEKAFGEMQGAYAMINREFARQIRADHPDIRYLNREEDMGIEGLRKAKESYYPDLLLEKHSAIRGE